MPTYEYRCPEGHHFELFQKMSDEPRAECPTCGLEASRLLSGGAGLVFKGSGFYITDYRSDSYRSEAKKEEGAPAEGKAARNGKGDKAGGSGSKEDGGGGSTASPKEAPGGSASGGGSGTSKPSGSSD